MCCRFLYNCASKLTVLVRGLMFHVIFSSLVDSKL